LFLSPERPWAGDVVETFLLLRAVVGFAGGGRRVGEGASGDVPVGLGDAFELGRRVIELRFGAALPAEVVVSSG
jgi:hypothetical protein